MLPSFIPYILQNLIWIPTQIILRFFGHFKVTGLENLKDLRGGVIFVSNHLSELDPILVPAALPMFSRFLPIFYVSREPSFYNLKRILKRIFYGGLFFKMWGAYPAKVGLHDYNLSLPHHIKLLERGNSVLIFPEGDKSEDGQLHEFKGGAAFLSHRTNTPIIPVIINGVYKTNFLDFFFLKKYISLSFNKPIYPDELFNKGIIENPHEYKILMNDKIGDLFKK